MTQKSSGNLYPGGIVLGFFFAHAYQKRTITNFLGSTKLARRPHKSYHPIRTCFGELWRHIWPKHAIYGPRPGWSRFSTLSGLPTINQLLRPLLGRLVIAVKHPSTSELDTGNTKKISGQKLHSLNFENGGSHFTAHVSSTAVSENRFQH